MGFAVATHNIMHGAFLDALIGHYRSLEVTQRLDVLCLQENREHGADGVTHADVISRALGGYVSVHLPEFPAVATLVKTDHEIVDRFLVKLPRLPRLSFIERTYIRGGKTKQKYALIVQIQRADHVITVANFHLDTAGDNQHRTAQVAAIAEALKRRQVQSHVVACGDTNAFTWARNPGLTVLEELMSPLTDSLGARLLVDGKATHFFARQREELLTHRALTVLGRLGIDHPLPYDVICSDLPAERRGQLAVDESDHDLVYAIV